MWQYYNPNPRGRRNVGDCAVRALTKALNVDWDTAFQLMVEKSFDLADLPSSNAVWGSLLKDYGFKRGHIPNTCPDCYTFEDFANEHPYGTYVLGTGTHTATVKSGILFDSWDSRREVPQYYWYRKD